MKTITSIIVLAIFMVGCSSQKSLKEIRQECKQNKQAFVIEKKFNYREGKYEKIGKCY